MDTLAVLDVRYYQRGDSRYSAVIECTNCPADKSLKVIPVTHYGMGMECSYVELVSKTGTDHHLTEWGCRWAVRRIINRVKKHVLTLQHKELYSELIVL